MRLQMCDCTDLFLRGQSNNKMFAFLSMASKNKHAVLFYTIQMPSYNLALVTTIKTQACKPKGN